MSRSKLRLDNKVIYGCFRRLLQKHFRELKPDEIHVHEVVQCLRKSYYERKYYSKRYEHISDTKSVILGLGLAVHEALENIFSRVLGAECEKEFVKTVYIAGNDIKVVGTVDLWINGTVVDLKTVNKIPDRPYDHHILQLQMYMWLTDTDTAYVVYICKRDGRVRVHGVVRDQRVIDRLIDRVAVFYKHLRDDTVPPPEETILCKYCEYSLDCFANGKSGGGG